MRVFLITAAALSLSFYAPSALGQSSATQALDRAYCLSVWLEEGHPDLERCEAFLEELVAEHRDEATERSVAVSRLTEVERRGTRRNAGVLGTIAAVGGLGGVGFVGGVFIGTGACGVLIGDFESLDCLFGGGSAGAAVGALLGMYQGYRWARPNSSNGSSSRDVDSSNGSSSRDVEQSDRQVIEFLPYPLAIVGGLAALFGSDEIGAPPYIGDGDSFGPLLTLGGVGMVGAAVYLARRNSRSEAGESPISLSLSPYRYDDASGLMFSGQF